MTTLTTHTIETASENAKPLLEGQVEMSSILRIDASARVDRSLTRTLGDMFVAAWQQRDPSMQVVQRDVGKNPPSFISEEWIAAAFLDENNRSVEQRTQLEESDRLITEIERADIIVITTPMYNYGMPASLKAWFDQVIRINKTFTFDLDRGDRPLEPILNGKSLILLTSTGEFAFRPGEWNENANHLTPHLTTLCKYLGADRARQIGIEYQEFCDERFEKSKADAFAKIPKLVLEIMPSSTTF